MSLFKKILFSLLLTQSFWQLNNLQAAEVAGIVERLQGDAQIISNSGSKSASVKSELFEGDKVTTSANSEILMRMTDGSVFSMRPNSNMEITHYHFEVKDTKSADSNIFIKLIKGGFRTVTGAIGKRNPLKVKINTPTATIGVRGTDFELAVLDENSADAKAGTYDKVFEGKTYMENSQGKQVDVAANQVAFSPVDALKMAKQFGLLKNVPNVFLDGKFDNLINTLQDEAFNRINSQLGGALPSEVKNLIPKLGDLFK